MIGSLEILLAIVVGFAVGAYTVWRWCLRRLERAAQETFEASDVPRDAQTRAVWVGEINGLRNAAAILGSRQYIGAPKPGHRGKEG